MPTYEYYCASCGHEFEEFQSIKADPLKVCPSCGNHSLKRKLGAGAGMLFKGDGFYLTDYKKPGGGDGKKSSSKPEKKSAESKKDPPSKDSATKE